MVGRQTVETDCWRATGRLHHSLDRREKAPLGRGSRAASVLCPLEAQSLGCTAHPVICRRQGVGQGRR